MMINGMEGILNGMTMMINSTTTMMINSTMTMMINSTMTMMTNSTTTMMINSIMTMMTNGMEMMMNGMETMTNGLGLLPVGLDLVGSVTVSTHLKGPGTATEETLMPCVVMVDLGFAMLNAIMLARTSSKPQVNSGASPEMLVRFGMGTF